MVWNAKSDLNGPQGKQGPSAYQVWLAAGNVGTESDFFKSLTAGALANDNVAFTLLEKSYPATPDPMTGLTLVANGPADFTGEPYSGTGALKARTKVRFDVPTPTTVGFRTFECWVKIPKVPTDPAAGQASVIVAFADGTAFGLFVAPTTGKVQFNLQSTPWAGPVITDGAYHHIAMSLERTSAGYDFLRRVFVDGVEVLEPSPGTSNVASSTGLTFIVIGGFVKTQSLTWETGGRMDSVRLSSGARYTQNFTPPTSLPSDGTTLAVFQMDPQKPAGIDYPPRPSVVGGRVTFIGSRDPSSKMLPLDRWYRV